MRENTEVDFWNRVERQREGCWIYRGRLIHNGYGHMSFGGKQVLAHRLAWELSFGAVPAGMYVCHRCDVRSCCRPDHLFIGNHSDNMQDMHNKKRHPGTGMRGEAAPWTKLTEKSVAEIRQLYSLGYLQRELGVKFGLAQTTVSQIVRGVRWAHTIAEEALRP